VRPFHVVQGALAALLLLGFVLPWVIVDGGRSLAGYQIATIAAGDEVLGDAARSLGAGAGYLYGFYLVPALALALVAAAVAGRGVAVVGLVTGLTSVALFLFWIGHFDTDLRGMVGAGLWLTIVAAALLLAATVVRHLDLFLVFVDRLSMWTGKTFAWCILILTFGLAYEVFMRYALRAPTGWAYDLSYMMYGALFFMAGAYTLSRNGHIRGDVLYRLWPPRVQAGIDLTLYILFYFPGVCALIYAGFIFARQSFMFREASVFSPLSVPIYQLKALIPIAGLVLFLQGVAELVRCVRCLQHGRWPPRYQDVEEIESAVEHLEEDKSHHRAATPAGSAER